MKKVSIVLPTYNGAKYLRRCLDTCLAQTYENFELIIVDGGSTDDTLSILAEYNDPRIILVHQPANSGRLPGALNLGFARSTGEYLTWMQDDNYYDPDAIDNTAHYLDNHPEVDFVYSTHWWIDENDKRLDWIHFAPPEELRKRNCLGQYFLYRRTVYEKLGDYDVDYVMGEDYEYWIRVYLNHPMAFINTPKYWYRVHPGSLTGRSYGAYVSARVATRARRKWFKTNWFEYRRDLSQAYIEEAFASFRNHDDRHLRKALVLGLLNNPAWIRNPGVPVLLFRKVLLYPFQALIGNNRKNSLPPERT